MSEAKEFVFIPEIERIPELEDKVQGYLANIPQIPKNTKKRERVVIPEFKSRSEEVDWQKQEIGRCINGYDGMCGLQYYYFNYCWIKNVTSKIPPVYRECDNWWLGQIQEEFGKKNTGIIAPKRRRIGASWHSSVIMDWRASFFPNRSIGAVSKKEIDSVKLFNKVKFVYNNLPQFLRIKSALANNRMAMRFGWYEKDAHGNKLEKSGSSIEVFSPADDAFEGGQYDTMIIDEAGKLPNLDAIWSYGEDALNDGYSRIGLPIIFGTAGEIEEGGASYKYMWDHADSMMLKRVFLGAWMGIIETMDEFGNDNVEENIRWVVYQRVKMRGRSKRDQDTFMQKYPLTPDEAFLNRSTGLGNPIKVEAQIRSLRENPPKREEGTFKMNPETGIVTWQQHHGGRSVIFERPAEGVQYIAGCDPVDKDDTVTNDISDIAAVIMRPQTGLEPPRLVYQYSFRHQRLNDDFEQILFAMIYFNKARVLMESNRGGRAIDFFSQWGNKGLLATTPQGILRLYNSTNIVKIGYTKTKHSTDYGEGLIDEYIEDYAELIPSLEILLWCQKYNPDAGVKPDLLDAWMACLMLMKEKVKPKDERKKAEVPKHMPGFYYKEINGKLIRMNKKPQLRTVRNAKPLQSSERRPGIHVRQTRSELAGEQEG